ncbi:hypothetical protein C0993_011950 [Termitomyces sp. T159_Od127]|nr:hypothetical protein C0993_011950 [Termitomyces sp. T159_Od127]
MVPLCKKFHWTQNEQYDAKTLQYKLLMSWVEDNSSPPTCKLSTIFGDLGAVADVSFVIHVEAKYKELSYKVEKLKHLNDLMDRSDTCPTVYLNADKAEFADSFVFLSLEQPSKHQYHILCIQSKLFKASALSIGQVEKEYEKVRLVCGSHPFTLVIAADRLTNNCLTQLANHTDNDLKSHVLVLNQEGFDIFYGKPFTYRRRFMTGLQSLPVFCEDEDNSHSP